MRAVTLQPAAGAQGELTGILMIRAYHRSRGDTERTEVLVPDSSHGTNPATASMAGFRTVTIPSAADGGVDVPAFEAALGPKTAAVMITNPSTLGLFESRIGLLLEEVHAAGALAYMDGANLNAILGRFKPGEAGFDVMHFNVHKTFSTPHGGGGPGCGAIGLQKHLEPFIPVPHLVRVNGKAKFDHDRPLSIGRVSGYYGQFLMAVRALTYMAAYGKEGLPQIARHAVLNANYVKARLKDVLPPAHDRPCMHECVLTGSKYKKHGVRVLDISKRLIDYGFHPPTNYFPLIVPECMMIEPTETECKETLDAFCDALIAICHEAETNPDLLHRAPTSQVVGRLNEAKAVKDLDVKWQPQRETSPV